LEVNLCFYYSLTRKNLFESFRHILRVLLLCQRVNRLGRTEVKNFVVFFENDAVTRWEGDYFPGNDKALAQQTVRQFGRNLPKDKKKKGR